MNGLGMYLRGATSNMISLNKFFNFINAVDEGTNSWNSSSAGNKWKDYNGTDADGNGIGDTPYVVNQTTGSIDYMVFDEWDDPLSLPAVDRYFEKLYSYEGDGLDKKRVLPAFEERLKDVAFPFEDVANVFNLIENDTRDIIIPYDDKARSIIKQIQQTGLPGKYVRNLQGYTVSIYVEEFKALEKSNAISSIDGRFFVLKKLDDYYSEDTGLLNRKYNDEDLLLIA